MIKLVISQIVSVVIAPVLFKATRPSVKMMIKALSFYSVVGLFKK